MTGWFSAIPGGLKRLSLLILHSSALQDLTKIQVSLELQSESMFFSMSEVLFGTQAVWEVREINTERGTRFPFDQMPRADLLEHLHPHKRPGGQELFLANATPHPKKDCFAKSIWNKLCHLRETERTETIKL